MLGTYYSIRNQRMEAERVRNSAAAAKNQGTSVVVVLSNSQTSGAANAYLWRRKGVDPANVIVLTPDATPVDLGAAIIALKKSRIERGDDLIDDEKIVIASAEVADPDGKTLGNLTRIVQSLRTAPFATVAGVGNVRATSVMVRPGR